jgi:hypothetical protein
LTLTGTDFHRIFLDSIFGPRLKSLKFIMVSVELENPKTVVNRFIYYCYRPSSPPDLSFRAVDPDLAPDLYPSTFTSIQYRKNSYLRSLLNIQQTCGGKFPTFPIPMCPLALFRKNCDDKILLIYLDFAGVTKLRKSGRNMQLFDTIGKGRVGFY